MCWVFGGFYFVNFDYDNCINFFVPHWSFGLSVLDFGWSQRWPHHRGRARIPSRARNAGAFSVHRLPVTLESLYLTVRWSHLLLLKLHQFYVLPMRLNQVIHVLLISVSFYFFCFTWFVVIWFCSYIRDVKAMQQIVILSILFLVW